MYIAHQIKTHLAAIMRLMYFQAGPVNLSEPPLTVILNVQQKF